MFKAIWSWIVGIFKSEWFKDLLAFLMQRTADILSNIGQDAVTAIKAEMARVNTITPAISGAKKFSIVFKFAVALLPGIPESVINYLIESLVQEIKNNPPETV